ncbi:hypothetical protein PYCC9005_003247 [Savitreella phatthalungensis]
MLIAGLFATGALAATHKLDWNITYVHGVDPDKSGNPRTVIGVNNAWPIPQLAYDYGDQVELTVNNQLGDQPTSMHAHGFFQHGRSWADGVPGMTQCPIPVGGSMLYNYTLEQNGTYWIHSHTAGQWPDGLRTPFIINSPSETYSYDEDITVYLSDWYHQPVQSLLPKFVSYRNPTGAEPVPDAALMNDQQNTTFSVQPGKTYRIRVLNVAAFAMFHFWIEGHDMQVIEVDGVDTKPYAASAIALGAAQRYSLLVTTKDDTTSNFAMVGSMDTSMFDTVPAALNNNVTGYLVYDKSKSLPTPKIRQEYDDADDFNFEPVVELAPIKADTFLDRNFTFDNLADGINYAFFNGKTYVMPKTPTMYTAMAAGNSGNSSLPFDTTIYGDYTITDVVKYNAHVQIVINNEDANMHPIHHHHYTFQVVKRGLGPFNASETWEEPANPMRRDVVQVPGNGHAVIRYVADNVGVASFHCHISFHQISGFVSTIITAPDLIAGQDVPAAQFANCMAQGVNVYGNAAGKTNLLDLTGQAVPAGPIPDGITRKGIVALFFNALCAVIGMLAIAWYGLGELRVSKDQAKEHSTESEKESGSENASTEKAVL